MPVGYAYQWNIVEHSTLSRSKKALGALNKGGREASLTKSKRKGFVLQLLLHKFFATAALSSLAVMDAILMTTGSNPNQSNCFSFFYCFASFDEEMGEFRKELRKRTREQFPQKSLQISSATALFTPTEQSCCIPPVIHLKSSVTIYKAWILLII